MISQRLPYVIATFVFALLLLALSQPTLAQVGGMSGMGGMGGGPGQRGGKGDGAKRDSNSAVQSARESEQRRFTELEEKLKVTDAQRPLWDKYADRLSAFTGDLSRNPTGSVIAKDNAVQQIDRKVDALRNRLAGLEEISDAARALYQTLSPAQKKEADALLANTIPGLFDNFQSGTPPKGERGERNHQGNNADGGRPTRPGQGGDSMDMPTR